VGTVQLEVITRVPFRSTGEVRLLQGGAGARARAGLGGGGAVRLHERLDEEVQRPRPLVLHVRRGRAPVCIEKTPEGGSWWGVGVRVREEYR